MTSFRFFSKKWFSVFLASTTLGANLFAGFCDNPFGADQHSLGNNSWFLALIQKGYDGTSKILVPRSIVDRFSIAQFNGPPAGSKSFMMQALSGIAAGAPPIVSMMQHLLCYPKGDVTLTPNGFKPDDIAGPREALLNNSLFFQSPNVLAGLDLYGPNPVETAGTLMTLLPVVQDLGAFYPEMLDKTMVSFSLAEIKTSLETSLARMEALDRWGAWDDADTMGQNIKNILMPWKLPMSDLESTGLADNPPISMLGFILTFSLPEGTKGGLTGIKPKELAAYKRSVMGDILNVLEARMNSLDHSGAGGFVPNTQQQIAAIQKTRGTFDQLFKMFPKAAKAWSTDYDSAITQQAQGLPGTRDLANEGDTLMQMNQTLINIVQTPGAMLGMQLMHFKHMLDIQFGGSDGSKVISIQEAIDLGLNVREKLSFLINPEEGLMYLPTIPDGAMENLAFTKADFSTGYERILRPAFKTTARALFWFLNLIFQPCSKSWNAKVQRAMQPSRSHTFGR